MSLEVAAMISWNSNSADRAEIAFGTINEPTVNRNIELNSIEMIYAIFQSGKPDNILLNHSSLIVKSLFHPEIEL